MHLNVAKAEYMLISSRQRLLNLEDTPFLKIGDQVIKRVTHSKTVGLQVDEHLKWDEHIKYISKKVVSRLGDIKKIRSFVPQETLITVYNSLIN